MDLYQLIVFVHVAAAVALLGGSVIASPAVRAALRRATTTAEVLAYLRIGRPLLTLEPAAAGIVLVSGIYLTSVTSFWTQGWVQVAVAFWLVNSGVAGAVVKPAITRISSEADASPDAPVGPVLDTLRSAPRLALAGDIVAANDAAMLYLMVMKPGLTASLLVVIVLNAAVAILRRVRSGAHGAHMPSARPSGV